MSAVPLSAYIRQNCPRRERNASGALPTEHLSRTHFSLRFLVALLWVLGACILAPCSVAHADELRAVKGLGNPESAIVGPDGRIYVSEIGEFNKDGDGRITVIDPSGAPKEFAKGLDAPKGLAARSDQALEE